MKLINSKMHSSFHHHHPSYLEVTINRLYINSLKLVLQNCCVLRHILWTPCVCCFMGCIFCRPQTCLFQQFYHVFVLSKNLVFTGSMKKCEQSFRIEFLQIIKHGLQQGENNKTRYNQHRSINIKYQHKTMILQWYSFQRSDIKHK